MIHILNLESIRIPNLESILNQILESIPSLEPILDSRSISETIPILNLKSVQILKFVSEIDSDSGVDSNS